MRQGVAALSLLGVYELQAPYQRERQRVPGHRSVGATPRLVWRFLSGVCECLTLNDGEKKICISYLFSDCDTLLIFKTAWNCIQELCKVDQVCIYLCVCVCLHVASLQLSIEDFRHLRWQVVGVAETPHSWRQEIFRMIISPSFIVHLFGPWVKW